MLPAQKSQKGGQPNALAQASKSVPKVTTIKTAPKAKIAVQSKPALPYARATRGLTLKGPKDKGATQIQNRLKKKSPWFQSILDPSHGADAKIPDETGVETGTTQLVFKDTINANAGGVAGFRTSTLYVNQAAVPDLTALEGDDGYNYDELGPLASTLELTWVAKGGFVGASDLRHITNAHRIVSASLSVQPETSLADNKGEYTLFSSAFTYEGTPLYSDIVNKYKSATIPMNVNSPGIVRWYPIAREDISFKSFIQTDGTTFSDAISSGNDIPYWELGFVGVGLSPGATFRICVTINYEFVPKFNSLNVLDSSPSPSDATEVDLVENWVQEMPVATTTTVNKVSSSPTTVSPQHGENDGDTGFGMFFNVVKEILPFAALLL